MFLYPNHEGYFRCPLGLTVIMTVCANEGHEVRLFDTTFMNVSENKDNKIREKAKQVKVVTIDNFFNNLTFILLNRINYLWQKKLRKYFEL